MNNLKIGVTGDTHGEDTIRRFLIAKRCEYTDLFVCGDFGYIFYDLPFEERSLDAISKLGINVYFIDGNHENFEKLSEYPISKWNGGKVQYIRPNIIHLMRGEIYNFHGLKLFTIGGANSNDKMWRKEWLDWWKEELPSKEERKYALDNLTKHNNKVDIVLTHTCYSSALNILGSDYRADEFTDFLEKIYNTVEYKIWYCGHMHVEKGFNKINFLYENIKEIKIK